MEWYIPITIIPGLGLIILSTSNILLSLNNEIVILENKEMDCTIIINDKLRQLKLLSIVIVFQYLGVLLFLISGVSEALFHKQTISNILLLSGVGLMIFSIMLLLHYALKAITIRQKHLQL